MFVGSLCSLKYANNLMMKSERESAPPERNANTSLSLYNSILVNLNLNLINKA